ncbi:RNA-binding protein 47 [Homalodisca vitripennis]|nr:RNA-binding protein 47 [Homalodisca vitripennis]
MDHSIPGFNWEQVNGCRILGPRKGDENYNPPLGSEVFVGKLPRDCFEFELYQFMSKVGPVYDIRLMVTLYGENRGFAFVRFYDPETAAKAIDEMNQKTIRPGRRIGVTISTDHRTLLLIGLDCRVSRDDIFKVCDSALPGNLMLVTELPSARPSYLLQYATHRAAAITKRSQTQMLPPQWGPSVRIIWQHNEEVEMRNKNRRSREAVRRMVELYKQKFSKQSLESSAILPVTDECSFMLNGRVNRHNCHYWSSENPHWMREAHTQYPLKVNVWLGVIDRLTTRQATSVDKQKPQAGMT